MKATFHLVTGFLGSGKTTLIDRLLGELSQRKRIAVIQNEFAPTGVDGKLLKRRHDDFHLVEINNGSVFCVCQLGTFHRTMDGLLETVCPELIFLEASGLADPISIIDLLLAGGLNDRVALGRIVSLVDAPNFFRGLSGLQRFQHQLMVADAVVVNKMDLFEGDLAGIESEIRKLNPWAAIHTASRAKVDWPTLTAAHDSNHRAAQSFEDRVSEGRPEMSACVLRTHDRIDRARLERFIADLQPDCPRIKGFMGLNDGTTVSFHSVYEKLEIEELPGYSGPSELIAFGEGLTVRELHQRFRACAEGRA